MSARSARLNVVDRITTPLAGKEFKEFKKLSNTGIVEGSLYYHYARMIECLYAAERIKVLAEDELICSTDIWATTGKINEEGVGVLEAPRGTLFHHYWVDKSGMIKKVNLIVATGNNNAAMNRAVFEVAKKYVNGNKLTEGMLNRVEAAIRCYDPCLSCSTHAMGRCRWWCNSSQPMARYWIRRRQHSYEWTCQVARRRASSCGSPSGAFRRTRLLRA